MDTRQHSEPADDSTIAAPIPGHLSADPFRSLDYAKEALIARATGGLSPAAFALAVADWLIHLYAAPGKQLELAAHAVSNARQLLAYAQDSLLGKVAPPLEPAVPGAHRFAAAAWNIEPFASGSRRFCVSEPGRPHRQFRIKSTAATGMSVGPDEWIATAEQRDGSWWPVWNEWLDAHGAAKRDAPPRMGLPDADSAILADAPGIYVFQK
jgi:hypothetical protein